LNQLDHKIRKQKLHEHYITTSNGWHRIQLGKIVAPKQDHQSSVQT